MLFNYKDPIAIIKKVLEILPIVVEPAIKVISIVYQYHNIPLWDHLLRKHHLNTTTQANMQIII